jgi:ABC-type lipoprotein export system ATPase subunit
MLKLLGLSQSFGDKQLFQDLNLHVDKGAHCLIQGPSGSGKTSLLNLVARLELPTSGTCFFEGKAFEEWGSPAAFRLKTLGILFQGLHLVESLNVLQNLQLIQEASGSGVESMALLKAMGVADLAAQSVRTLSRGEAQRVAMARAFVNSPRLILADEPTSSLDPTHQSAALDQLFSMCAQTGATALVVSHSPVVAERGEFAQRIAL